MLPFIGSESSRNNDQAGRTCGSQLPGVESPNVRRACRDDGSRPHSLCELGDLPGYLRAGVRPLSER
jgi:hypothetical protein